MTVDKLVQIIDKKKPATIPLYELAKYYNCPNNELSTISDEMVDKWLEVQKCDCFQEGHWFLKDYGCGTCLGTKEKEPCTCGGNKTFCNFYKSK